MRLVNKSVPEGFIVSRSKRLEAETEPRPTWGSLSRSARLFRVAHGVWGAFNLAALGHIWLSALRRRRRRSLAASVGLLGAEGVALVIGRGDCPFGSFQRSLGDPVPMFEWVLPPKAAKAAVPALAVITLGGLASLVLRPPLRG